MKLENVQRDTIIFGFDSAWAGNSPGAICSIAFDAQGNPDFHEPRPVSFGEAFEFIRVRRQGHQLSLVAIDQPTIVPNREGSRPVDRVAGTLMSFVGGGVQPVNRSERNRFIFGDDAPIWRFISQLDAAQEPMEARSAASGHFLIEVFPALALLALHSDFCRRGGIPKYNPANRNTFQLEHWQTVARVVAAAAGEAGVDGLASWAEGMAALDRPGSRHQDKLDAAVCVLAGLIWRGASADRLAMIGDVESGYMVTPVSDETRQRLEAATDMRDVPLSWPEA